MPAGIDKPGGFTGSLICDKAAHKNGERVV